MALSWWSPLWTFSHGDRALLGPGGRTEAEKGTNGTGCQAWPLRPKEPLLRGHRLAGKGELAPIATEPGPSDIVLCTVGAGGGLLFEYN